MMLLCRSSNQQSVCVGIPYHGKDQAQLDALCGYFINMFVLYGQPSRTHSFIDLLQQCKDQLHWGVQHAGFPFPELVDSLVKSSRFWTDMSWNILYQTICNYHHDSGMSPSGTQHLPQDVVQIDGIMDLDFLLRSMIPDQMKAIWSCCIDIFEVRTVEKISREYELLLESCILPEWQGVSVWHVSSSHVFRHNQKTISDSTCCSAFGTKRD